MPLEATSVAGFSCAQYFSGARTNTLPSSDMSSKSKPPAEARPKALGEEVTLQETVASSTVPARPFCTPSKPSAGSSPKAASPARTAAALSSGIASGSTSSAREVQAPSSRRQGYGRVDSAAIGGDPEVDPGFGVRV